MKFSSLFNVPKKLFGDSSQSSSQDVTDFSESEEFDGTPVDEQIASRRYCRALAAENLNDVDAATAWVALEESMSIVVGGKLSSGDPDIAASGPMIAPFFMDRHAVTNADFAHFVNSGIYSEMELWPQEIWPNVMQFVDSTGLAGPRFWENGRPPKKKASHPIVGITWYEASLYAEWVGKRLPTSAEWEFAGSWPNGLDGRSGKVRYPWGNSFDPARANTWSGGNSGTVPVDDCYSGCTPNGIYQLVGNVWEWVATPYVCSTGNGGLSGEVTQPMGEIRGGAFDTYFETQATCQFRTGQPLFYRGINVGFRCCLDANRLNPPPQPAAFL